MYNKCDTYQENKDNITIQPLLLSNLLKLHIKPLFFILIDIKYTTYKKLVC